MLHVALRSFAVRRWATLPDPRWIELCRDGLVVQHRGGDGGDALTLLPWNGAPRALFEAPSIARFCAAKAGTAVLASVPNEALRIDVDRAGEPRRLAGVAGAVTNAEMAPDGSRAAFATEEGLFAIAFNTDRRAAPARRASERPA